MDEKKVLLIGLVGAGKTTFLAALWQLVDSQIEEKSFELRSLVGDQEYLNSIREAWLSYNSVPRTLLKEGNKKAEMKLTNVKTHEDVVLIIPDLSGEIFEQTLQLRQLREDLNEIILESEGIILFVNPAKINKANLIVHAQELEHLIMSDAIKDVELEVEEEYVDDLKPWSHEMVPSQVKLIDLIQMILSRNVNGGILKLSVVISAWDLIEVKDQNSIEPARWIEVNLPMFYQYIKCNSTIIEAAYFGVSAQGADYKSDKIDQLYDMTDPTERIIVKFNSVYSHDISLPILWVANQV